MFVLLYVLCVVCFCLCAPVPEGLFALFRCALARVCVESPCCLCVPLCVHTCPLLMSLCICGCASCVFVFSAVGVRLSVHLLVCQSVYSSVLLSMAPGNLNSKVQVSYDSAPYVCLLSLCIPLLIYT